jgi:hypothetical protein
LPQETLRFVKLPVTFRWHSESVVPIIDIISEEASIMRLRVMCIMSLVLVLLVTGVVSAQQGGRGNRGGQQPPNGANNGGGNRGNGNGGNNGGQQPPNGGNNGGGGNGGGGGAIAFPAGYANTFALYTVVDRPDNVSRLVYINRESLAALQAGQPLPNGTTLVIEAYNSTLGADGRLVRGALQTFIHVSQKIDGRWRFASFTANGAPADRSLVEERPGECVDCHNDTRDFVFTRPQINAFAASQTTQYLFCGLPGREPC